MQGPGGTSGRGALGMTARRERNETEREDFISSDGYVSITAEEFGELKRRCPSIRNVRRMLQSACDGWLKKLPPHKRKQVLIQWLLERAGTMRPPKPRKRRPAETMRPPDSMKRRRAPVSGERWTWEWSLPETFEEYAARFIREGDDEEMRQGILSRAREGFERRLRNQIVDWVRWVREIAKPPPRSDARLEEGNTSGCG
jgi:hypothetical protein